MQKLPSALFGLGLVVLLLTVVVGWIVAPIIIEDFVSGETRFAEGNWAWKKWQNMSGNEILMKIYMFNVTNPSEVENGKLPILQEMGPYVWQEKRHKEVLKVDKENDTIEYNLITKYHFRRDLSVGSDEDIVTTINIPLVAVSQRLNEFPYMIRILAGMYIMKFKETLFIERTVAEMTFKGYHSEMVKELQNLIGEQIVFNNTVGIYYHKEKVDNGSTIVRAGNKHYSQFNEIVAYNGSTTLPYWAGDKCNKLKGSYDANTFPPLSFVSKKTLLPIFHPDFCRIIHMKYSKNTEFMGVPAYRFEFHEDNWKDETEVPENECYCIHPGKDRKDCLKSGVQTLYSCKTKLPVSVSLPHFLNAPYYLNKTIGLNPNKEMHTPYIDVEPTIGIITQAAKRGQVNVDLKPVRELDQLRKVPKMQFPVLWQEEYVTFDEEMQGRVKSEFQGPINIFNSARWAALAVSVVILSFSVSVLAMRARKKDYFI